MRGPFDPSSQPESIEGTPLRVLLVEDHPDLAEVTAELLGAEGLSVRTVLSGRKALEVAPAFLPQLVLCDVNLPDMTGLEVVRELRLSPSTARSYIVLFTAFEREVLSNRELNGLGVDAFISKPITIQAVRRLVEELGQRAGSEQSSQ